MELSEKGKLGMEKREDHLNYPSYNIPLDWQFGGGNLANPSAGSVPMENSVASCNADMVASTCSSISMVDPFPSSVWDNPSSQSLPFVNDNIQTSSSTTDVLVSRNFVAGSLRSGGMEKTPNISWNPSNLNPGGANFVQTGAGLLPENLSQFPTDSAFIERAARFSCFNSENLSTVVNPFGISESFNPYMKSGGIRMLEFLSGNGLSSVSRVQLQNELHLADVSKDCIHGDNGVTEGCLTNNEREGGYLLRPSDEGKHGNGASSNESDEAEVSGGDNEELSISENAIQEPPPKVVRAKKRKKCSQGIELDQGSPHLSKEIAESSQKSEPNPTSVATKSTAKHNKDGSQNSDAPKEDYIHIRARRGQATNSHSLAERVRREKISERMKFLQDLVPGCSKVTGKAVMLDEIINYVQSLQRQVEFLSMKLAAVNPRLDLNIEALLSKNIFQSQGCTPSTIGFLPDMSMAHSQLYPVQQGLIQAGKPTFKNHTDILRRATSSQLTNVNGFKEPTPQINNAWDHELHNVVQMSFGTSGPFNTQEMNGSLPPSNMKLEP